MEFDSTKYEMRETFGICDLPDLLWQKSDQGAFGRIIAGRAVDGPIFDLVADSPKWLDLVENKDTVVQAGGCMGMYPLFYSKIFSQVYTFEPDESNYYCLDYNCQSDNIHKFNTGLGATKEPMKLIRLNQSNAGMHRVVSNSVIENNKTPIPKELVFDVEMKTVDELDLQSCDLLHLDVEHYELEALVGAENTIDRCSPVIVLETNTKPSPADGWLQYKGYKIHSQLRMDAVYTKSS